MLHLIQKLKLLMHFINQEETLNFLSLSIWRPKRNVYIIWKPRYQK